MAVKAMTTLHRVSTMCALLAAGFVLDVQAQPTPNSQTAAQATATSTTNACNSIVQFYWEVGDKNQRLGHGTKGLLPPSATTKYNVASAGKWMYGAYVHKKHGNAVTAADIKALTMRTGYNNSSSCALSTTVNACFNAGIGANKNNVQNGQQSTPATTPPSYKFYYGSGSFQKHAAVDMGLGSLTNAALKTEMQNYLGADIDFSFVSPEPAAGVRIDAENYGLFLRKLLKANTLLLGNVLGSNAVCTVCANSEYTPSPTLAWHYSLGHWVENEPGTGDGAFSSPGIYGFYPWIDSARVYYGILARSDIGTGTAATESAACGRLIRKAWQYGVQY